MRWGLPAGAAVRIGLLPITATRLHLQNREDLGKSFAVVCASKRASGRAEPRYREALPGQPCPAQLSSCPGLARRRQSRCGRTGRATTAGQAGKRLVGTEGSGRGDGGGKGGKASTPAPGAACPGGASRGDTGASLAQTAAASRRAGWAPVACPAQSRGRQRSAAALKPFKSSVCIH